MSEPTRIPSRPLFAPIAKALAPLFDAHRRGIVIDSPHIVAERQPDGRVYLRLHPDLYARLAALEAKVAGLA